MRTIILAAGFGKRLCPLTERTPKPLLKVANVPIIESQIRGLLANDSARASRSWATEKIR